MDLKLYTSVAKELILKVRKFLGLIFTFAEVTGEKLVEGHFWPLPFWVGLNMFCYARYFLQKHRQMCGTVSYIQYFFNSKFFQKGQLFTLFSHILFSVAIFCVYLSNWKMLVTWKMPLKKVDKMFFWVLE